jgi:tetratricopeptide (TPR) repeat protein
MTLPDPTPDEMIIALGLSTAPDIDQALLDACDEALDAKERPQDHWTAFNCLRAILMRHWDNPDPSVQRHVAEALLRRAQMLAHLKRIDEARADYDELWSRYEDCNDPNVRNSLAVGLCEAGKLEARHKNWKMAKWWYSLTARFAESENDNVQLMIVRAQDHLGELHADTGEMKQALAVFDWAIERWAQHHDYWIRRSVSNTRHSKATALMDGGEYEAALHLFDEAMVYADRLTDPPAFFPQISARLSKCYCLERMKRYGDVVEAVEDLEHWVDQTARPDPHYRGEDRESTEHLFRRAMMTKARCLHRLRDFPSALDAYDRTGRVIDDIDSCTEASRHIVEDLAWGASILADIGRVEEAREFFYSIGLRLAQFNRPPEWDFGILEVTFHLAQQLGIKEFQDLTTPTDGSPDPS